MGTTLVNFNIPNNLKDRFDDVCRMSGRTRTSMLIELIASYVIDQSAVLEARQRRLHDAGCAIQTARHLSERKSDLDSFPIGGRIGVHTPSEFDFDDDGDNATSQIVQGIMLWDD